MFSSVLKLFLLLILLAIITSIINHVVISLIEKLLKTSIKPIIESLCFPGVIMKNAWLKITASLFGYEISFPVYSSTQNINYETMLYSRIKSPIKLFIIIFSPYLNLALIAFLIATKIWVQDVIPPSMYESYNLLLIYLSISILISGTPNAHDVFVFLNTIIQKSPWFFVLTMWGIISALFMKQVLGVFPSTIFFLLYEAVLIFLELKNKSTIYNAKNSSQITYPSSSNNNSQNLRSSKRSKPYLAMIIIKEDNKRK